MTEAENSQPMMSQSLLVQPAAPSSSSTIDASGESTAPWYRQRWFRLLIIRVLVRLAMLGLFFALIKTGIIPFGEWLHAYLDWINSLPLGLSLFVFSICCIPFSAFTPGSYAPTVVAGVTFPWYIAFPLSYVCINASAMLNLVVIRYGGACDWMKKEMMDRMERRGDVTVSKMDSLLLHHPVRMVMLLRLPYLASGILNYYFSSSRLSARHQFIGNSIGLLPGALLFSLLGAQARSLVEIVVDGQTDPASIALVVIVAVFVLTCIIGIAHLVKKKTKQHGAQVVAVPGVIGDETAPPEEQRHQTESLSSQLAKELSNSTGGQERKNGTADEEEAAEEKKEGGDESSTSSEHKDDCSVNSRRQQSTGADGEEEGDDLRRHPPRAQRSVLQSR